MIIVKRNDGMALNLSGTAVLGPHEVEPSTLVVAYPGPAVYHVSELSLETLATLTASSLDNRLVVTVIYREWYQT